MLSKISAKSLSSCGKVYPNESYKKANTYLVPTIPSHLQYSFENINLLSFENKEYFFLFNFPKQWNLRQGAKIGWNSLQKKQIKRRQGEMENKENTLYTEQNRRLL